MNTTLECRSEAPGTNRWASNKLILGAALLAAAIAVAVFLSLAPRASGAHYWATYYCGQVNSHNCWQGLGGWTSGGWNSNNGVVQTGYTGQYNQSDVNYALLTHTWLTKTNGTKKCESWGWGFTGCNLPHGTDPYSESKCQNHYAASWTICGKIRN